MIAKTDSTLTKGYCVWNPSGLMEMLMNDPKVVASSSLGLKLANAFGVIFKDLRSLTMFPARS